MKNSLLFPREEGEYQPLSYWLSVFFLYYAGTIIGIFIALASGRGIGVFAAAALSGFGIDMIRRFIAPELQLSSAQRHNHIQRALNDKTYMRYCSNKYRLTVGLVYYAWGAYFVLMLCIPALREPSAFTQNVLVRALINLASTLCPFLSDRQGLVAAFATDERVFVVVNFMAITWYFTLVATILEVSGGGFYSAPKGIERLINSHNHRGKTKWTSATFTRTMITFLVLSVACYFSVGLFDLVKGGVVSSGINKGHPISFYDLVKVLCLFGGSFLATAIFVRLFYNNIFYRISGIHWSAGDYSQ